MSQKKRSDKNSVTAALGGFKGAMDSVPPPEGVQLRSDEEMVIWDQFTRARTRGLAGHGPAFTGEGRAHGS